MMELERRNEGAKEQDLPMDTDSESESEVKKVVCLLGE